MLFNSLWDVASEFPFFGVPVINACNNNLHSSYDFSITPKTKEDYENLLKRLSQIKVSEKVKEVMIDFFFMRHILIDKNWLFDDYDLMIEEIGGYHNLQSFRFYKFFIFYCDKEKIRKAEENIRKFLNGDDVIFQIEK